MRAFFEFSLGEESETNKTKESEELNETRRVTDKVNKIDEEQGAGSFVELDNFEGMMRASSLKFLKTKVMVNALMSGKEPEPQTSMEFPIEEQKDAEDEGSFMNSQNQSKNVMNLVDSNFT